VPQGEVLQGVGADLGLGGLDRLTVSGRDQLGADLGVQDGQQNPAASSEKSFSETTHRMRCWMRVLGIPALTL